MQMKNKYTLLWLFSDLCDLYGDGGNLTMIEKRLAEMGRSCEILRPGAEETPDLASADVVYIGPGKAANVEYAASCMAGWAGELRAAVDDGKAVLVTGNGRELLGAEFETPSGGKAAGAGIFAHTAHETGSVFVSDVVGRAQVPGEPRCYGFINRTAHLVGDCGEPLFKLERGAGDGEGVTADTEGSILGNLFATWCVGPVLVRNPDLLRDFMRRFTEGELPEFDDALERRALALTLSEFDKK